MTDADAIRDVISTWHAASKAGDVETVLGLMTEDVVFLTPGRPPMRKEEFATISRGQPGAPRPKFESEFEIQEIQVAGEWAFLWTRLAVMVSPTDGSPAIKRAGHTLSVFRKVGGKWLLARDANLLAVVPKPED